jgi:hypothetical protein
LCAPKEKRQDPQQCYQLELSYPSIPSFAPSTKEIQKFKEEWQFHPVQSNSEVHYLQGVKEEQ